MTRRTWGWSALWLAGSLTFGLVTGCNESAAESTRKPVPPSPQSTRPALTPSRSVVPVAFPAPARTDFVLAGEPTQGGWLRGTAPAGTASLSLDGAPVRTTGDGTFLLAFDRDAKSPAILVATLANGKAVTRSLVISPRAWRIENIDAARRAGGPTEDFMKIRRPELARIAAARRVETQAQGWRQAFVWPVRGRISGLFGAQRIYRGEPGAYHGGTDITTGTGGTPFVAPADGVVVLAADQPFTLEGHLLMIDHGMGLNSAFLHCSRILVREGEAVKQGQVIGLIGMSGRATGPHLHWGLRWNSARLDPMLFAGPMR